MNFYKLGISVFLISIFLINFTTFGQTPGNISIGNDFPMPICKSCTTLHAIITQPTFSSGSIASTSSYAMTQIAYNPYPFTGSLGAITMTVDDKWSGVFNFPFPVCFTEGSYTQFIIGGNGLLSFDISKANTTNAWSFNAVAPLPNTTFNDAKNSIMIYHDMNPGLGGTFTFDMYGVAPNRVFVINWNNVPLFSCTSLMATQQIALYETTNVVETYILNKPLCANWNAGQAIHGIENATGTNAWIVPGRNLPAQWTATNDAWRFTPNGTSTGGNNPLTTDIKWYNINKW